MTKLLTLSKYLQLTSLQTVLSVLHYNKKVTGFKSLRINYLEINHVASKCQIDFWTKLSRKGLKQKKRTSPSNLTYLK